MASIGCPAKGAVCKLVRVLTLESSDDKPIVLSLCPSMSSALSYVADKFTSAPPSERRDIFLAWLTPWDANSKVDLLPWSGLAEYRSSLADFFGYATNILWWLKLFPLGLWWIPDYWLELFASCVFIKGIAYTLSYAFCMLFLFGSAENTALLCTILSNCMLSEEAANGLFILRDYCCCYKSPR